MCGHPKQFQSEAQALFIWEVGGAKMAHSGPSLCCRICCQLHTLIKSRGTLGKGSAGFILSKKWGTAEGRGLLG